MVSKNQKENWNILALLKLKRNKRKTFRSQTLKKFFISQWTSYMLHFEFCPELRGFQRPPCPPKSVSGRDTQAFKPRSCSPTLEPRLDQNAEHWSFFEYLDSLACGNEKKLFWKTGAVVGVISVVSTTFLPHFYRADTVSKLKSILQREKTRASTRHPSNPW